MCGVHIYTQTLTHIHKTKPNKNFKVKANYRPILKNRGARETVQQLRVFAVLVENWGSVPSPHIKHFTNTCNSCSRGCNALCPPCTLSCMW